MARPIELTTDDQLEYNFFPNNAGICQFRVRAANDAHVALTTGAAVSDPMYEIFIGGWGNSKSVIRKNRTKPEKAESPTPGILSSDELRGFWVRWGNGNVSAGREGEHHPFVSWDDDETIPISYVGVCTGWGATGSWIIEPPQAAPAGAVANVCWVAADGGNVPPNALAGGEDNGETVYVIRAQFQGGLIPGKLVASHGVGYVPWGGNENAVPSYEVLCGCRGTWVATSGGNIPANALSAGETEEGEALFVGRVVHDGALTVGKVQQSHGCLYIPFGGQEMRFEDYEVLTS